MLRELSEKGGLGQVREEKGKLRAALQFQLWSCPVGRGGFLSKKGAPMEQFEQGSKLILKKEKKHPFYLVTSL